MCNVFRSHSLAHVHRVLVALLMAFSAKVVALPLPAQGTGESLSPRMASAEEVRELGRLERADMVSVILPFLASGSAEVRAEAANALAQSLWPLTKGASVGGGLSVQDGDSAVAVVATALRSRLARERDPAAKASLAQALGRLPYRSASERGATESLLARELAATDDSRVAAGAARGLLSLLSAGGRTYTPSARTVRVLRSRVRAPSDRSADLRGSWADSSFAWPRRMAMLALLASRSMDVETLRAAAHSGDAQLRMLAARGAGTLGDGAGAGEPLGALLHTLAHDGAPIVRTEVARVWSRGGESACAALLPLATDSSPQTSVSAIDAIGAACTGESRKAKDASESVLVKLVRAWTVEGVGDASPGVPGRIAMHRAAHAMVALAHVSPVRAAELLASVAASRAWQARMYAARAAAVLSDTAMLLSLASDRAPNVRTEAITGLSRVAGHAADSVYISALSSGDYQLVLTAAHALGGTPRPAAAVTALESSLARITSQKRETSRDPRLAILQTLRELGSPDLAEPLLPYLADFDSVVADSAAAIVSSWTGRAYHSAPRPLPDVDGPPSDIATLSAIHVRVTMAAGAGGGSFELRLFPDDAPLTVSRFTRLVRSGYYDGLTIHRVVPNFVVQGGSPGANEYMGDGPFLRDEVGLRSHRRGAVGISTRGRNTGDAQFFIDLVDLPRLDHDYTVFAEVVSGMATVDRLLEGDVMQKVEIVTPP
jgi:cyclophilin family peptidyl-prolyl cis-trans isomerase/HEAT repeat protein